MIHLLNRILILKLSGLSIQCIQQKIASQRSFHTINVITLGTTSNTTTPLRNRGRVLHQTVCHWPALMLKFIRLLSTQPRTVNRRSYLTTNVTMPGTMSNTSTPLRNRGRPPHQTVCRWPELMLRLIRLLSTQPKIVNRKSFHITSVTTLGMMSNTTTPLRSHGRPPRQMECH